MKKIFTFLAAVLLTASVFAQSPQKMSYQAVIRNSSDALVCSINIGMQISILQGSANGTAVYVERHFSSTNANGLVSIEIGAGTVVSGNFANIDWTAGSYFIKTETDLNGGANYTITGTSQLLSVPYALNAKTAENGITTVQANAIIANTAKVGITTAEQTKLASIATGAEVNVNADWNAVTGDAQILNKPTIPAAADGSETKVTAGTNVTVTGSGTTASPYVVNATSGGSTLAIGDSYQGGIIFWLDATGQHGLIAATEDQSTGIQWYNGTYRYTGTTGNGLYAGAMNTAMIVATQMADNQSGSFAAKVCADYSVTVGRVTYGDWYLPSKYELNLLYLQKIAVGGFASAYYWSSTESNNDNAWIQYFDNGFQSASNKSFTYRVRAVRAF